MSVPLDVRYGLRRLNNNVAFTMVAVACLALGICASITVFAVADALLIRDFPGVADQDRIVSVATRPLTPGAENRPPVSYQTYLHYRQANHVFSELAAFHSFPMNFSGAGEPLRLRGYVVSDNYFTTLGMRAASGRLFDPGNSGRGDRREVVLSHALWQRAFSGRGKVLGSAVQLNGTEFRVIGVAPEGFRGTVLNVPADLWVSGESAPLFLPPVVRATRDVSTYRWLFFFFGRLAPGVDAARAQAELDVLTAQIDEGVPPDQRQPGLAIHEDFGFYPGMRVLATNPLLRLSGLVTLLMLVVCANLGGLLLVKAAARREEIGVRLALGVTRGQLVRQLLTESIALSLLGGLAGFLMSLFVVDVIRGWPFERYLPTLDNVVMDGRVVAFTLLLSVGTGVLFGLTPALWATRRQPMPLLHHRDGGGPPDGGRLRFQEALVVAQVTFSLILLVSTGLIVRTLQNLYSVDPGFRIENVLKVSFDLSQGDPRADGPRFQSQLLEQVRRLPQVRDAALAYSVPLTATSFQLTGTLRRPSEPEETALETECNVVTPGFFQTLEIPLVRGRDFTPEDRNGSTPVLIVDETAATLLWPGRNPVGEQVAVANGEKWESWQVVGVVRRIHSTDLSADPLPFFYVPLAQRYMAATSLQIKTSREPSQAVEPVREVFRQLAPNLAVQVTLLEDDVNKTLAQPRFFSVLLGSFSLIALLVTATGLYGSLSYAVSRRTRELGIRMALGARSAEIMGMVLRRGLALTLVGLALGTLAAVWITSVLSGLLFGVTPTDPGVFFTVAAILVLVGFLASSLPAWRATRVDPMAIIRHE
ncbi:MAG TPA: ABC transporter permease [Thermoanaerobaculia bacterium]